MTLRSARLDVLRALLLSAIAYLLLPSSASADQVIVRDRFSGTTLSGHRPDTNLAESAWSTTGSGATLWGQRAWAAGADWAGILATIDSGVADGTVAVDWIPGGDMPYGAVVARATDTANYLVAFYWSGMLSLSKVAAGGYTLLASTPIDDPGDATHRLTLVLAGSSIQVWYDGVRRLSATDAFNVTVTRHGFRWLSHYNWQSTYGNFEVAGAYVPAAATVTVTPSPLHVSFLAPGTLTATAYDAAHRVIPAMSFAWSSSNPSAVAVTAIANNTASAIALGAGSATITATPTQGTSGTATVTVDTGAIAVLDTFAGNDATRLTAHAPNVSPPFAAWSATGSGATLNGHHARAAGADWDPITATIDAGIADGTVGIDWTPVGENPAAAVVARVTSRTSYLAAVYWSRTLSLYRVADGTHTLLGEAVVDDPIGATHRLEVKLAGPDVEVWWDRVQQIVAVDAFNATATRHGFRWYSYWDWQSMYDRFEVSALPAIASVVVTPASATIPMNGGRVLTAQAYDAAGAPIPGISFTWSSSNGGVASTRVASPTSGAIVAEGIGRASVTATAFGGQARATADVTVAAPPPPPPPSSSPVSSGCMGGVFPPGTTWPADGGIGEVTVSAAIGCEWDAASNVPWMIPLQTSGAGDRIATYAVDANTTGAPRSGTLSYGGATFAVTQTQVFSTTSPTRSASGADGTGGAGCTIALSRPEGVLSFAGGQSSVSFAAPAGCEWRASTDADWLTLVDHSGVGNGTVTVVAPPNPNTMWRLGVVSIGGKPFAVLQDGTAVPSPPISTMPESTAFREYLADKSCTYEVYPSRVVVAYGGGASIAHVITPQSCPWTPTTDAAWLTLSDQESIPKRDLIVTATANVAPDSRSAIVRIGPVTLEVYQEGTASAGTAPSPEIDWFLLPDENRVNACLGNCGAGCTDQIKAPIPFPPFLIDVPAPCGKQPGWTVEALTPPVYTGNAIWLTECNKPNGREKQQRYDLYTATGRYTYRGRWASQCLVHDQFCRPGTGSKVECAASLANPVLDLAVLLCADARDETWTYPPPGQPGVAIFGRSKRPVETFLTGNQCPATP